RLGTRRAARPTLRGIRTGGASARSADVEARAADGVADGVRALVAGRLPARRPLPAAAAARLACARGGTIPGPAAGRAPGAGALPGGLAGAGPRVAAAVGPGPLAAPAAPRGPVAGAHARAARHSAGARAGPPAAARPLGAAAGTGRARAVLVAP